MTFTGGLVIIFRVLATDSNNPSSFSGDSEYTGVVVLLFGVGALFFVRTFFFFFGYYIFSSNSSSEVEMLKVLL